MLKMKNFSLFLLSSAAFLSCKTKQNDSESKLFDPQTGQFDNAMVAPLYEPVIRNTDLNDENISPAQHSHLIFGDDVNGDGLLFAEHLPLYDDHQHKYQIVYSIRVKWPDSATRQRYLNEKAYNSISFIPEIKLNDIANGYSFPQPLPLFKTTYKKVFPEAMKLVEKGEVGSIKDAFKKVLPKYAIGVVKATVETVYIKRKISNGSEMVNGQPTAMDHQFMSLDPDNSVSMWIYGRTGDMYATRVVSKFLPIHEVYKVNTNKDCKNGCFFKVIMPTLLNNKNSLPNGMRIGNNFSILDSVYRDHKLTLKEQGSGATYLHMH